MDPGPPDPAEPSPAEALGQFDASATSIDLAWGHPDPDLLPVAALRDAATRALERYGADALGYGRSAGARPFVEAVRRRLATIDGRTPDLDEIVLTGGNSSAIDQVATLFTRPGDVVLVESPTYHLALQIFREHPLHLVPVPASSAGLDAAALAEAVHRERRAGRVPRLVYAVPTHGNPTGSLMPLADRGRLAEVLREEGLLLVEDDAYRELTFDGPTPPSIWSLATPGTVVRLGSFSKSLAPGLRVGYATATPELVARIADSGTFHSGGAISHFASLVVTEVMRDGAYAAHVERLRAAYRERRDALARAVAERLPAARVSVPAGGYFLWIRLPGVDAARLEAAANREGTGLIAGSRFGFGEPELADHVRLSFSRYPPDALEAAAGRLARAVASLARG